MRVCHLSTRKTDIVCVFEDVLPECCFPTCCARGGSSRQGAKRRVWSASHVLLRVALHHSAVLAVAVTAAPLSGAALLGAHCVAAAVVAERTAAQPGKGAVSTNTCTRGIGVCVRTLRKRYI